MATFAIESNGRIEKTAVYFNGEQLAGLKEILVHIDEDGTFDAIVQYTGTDEKLHIKNIFHDTLTNIKVQEPSFTEEEAKTLTQLVIESDGTLEDTLLLLNGEELDGVVSILIHIKSNKIKESGLKAMFGAGREAVFNADFQSEITYRNEDDSLDTERIF